MLVYRLADIVEDWELTTDEQNELKDALITRDGTLRERFSTADVLPLIVAMRSKGLRITVFEPIAMSDNDSESS